MSGAEYFDKFKVPEIHEMMKIRKGFGRVANYLESKNKKISFANADGNCGFNSWSIAMLGNESSHAKYRSDASSFILQHEELFDKIHGGGSSQEHAKDSISNGAYAEISDFIALSCQYGVAYKIFKPQRKKNAIKLVYPPEEYLHVFVDAGLEVFEFIQWNNHYDLIVNKEDEERPYDYERPDVDDMINMWTNIVRKHYKYD